MAELPPLPPGFSLDQPQQSSGPVTIGSPRPPKPKDAVDLQSAQLGVQEKQLDIAKKQREAATGGGGTGEQGMAAGFYQRALYANRKYGPGVPPRDPITQKVADILPTGVVNYYTGHDRQLADTYARDFIAATLRKESGAAIGPQEYENQYVRYFPQPGDNADTIAAKARLRDTAIQALRNQAGPAADMADQSVQKMLSGDEGRPVAESVGQFGNPENKNPMTPEQQAAYDAWLKANPKATPDQLQAFVHSIGLPGLDNAQAVSEALNKTGAFAPGETAIQAQDPRATALTQQYMQQGGGPGAAAIAGVADTAGLGFSDELGAGLNALGGSLSGQGSFGDLYNVNLQANRGYQDQLQQQNPLSYTGGQVAGGALLPTGGVSDAKGLAALAAAYGGAYGVGSGTDAQSRVVGGLEGGAAGGALGYGAGKLSGLIQRSPNEAVPLVDPVTGELNQPMDAMSAGQRVAEMRDLGMNTITPGMAGGRTARVLEQGFNNVPGSAGVMEDVNSQASRELRSSMQGVAQQFGTSKTLSEGGAELQRGANEYLSRSQELTAKAYNAIPISDKAQTSLGNTRAVLGELSSQFDSNPALADAVRSSKIDQYANALSKGDLSWRDLKAFRTRIGEAIGERRFSDDSATSDLRSLYGALSQDMRDTAQAQGPGALRAFERANNLYRQQQRLVDGALTRILGNNGQMTPEKAAAAIQAMTKGGKSSGDLKTLAQIKGATVKSGAWDEIASTLIHLGGQPANSEGRAFNPQTFVNWYADMSEPARAMLFKPELRTSLDRFVALSQQVGRVKGMTNSSNTTPTMIGSGVVMAGGFAAFTSHPAAILAVLGGGMANNLMARAWTSPKFVNLITGFVKAANSGSDGAVKSQIGRLNKLAATNPELREAVESVIRNIANDNTPNAGAVAASPNEGPQNQAQPY